MRRIYQAILIALLAFFLRAYLAYTGPIENDEVVYAENVVQFNLALRQGNWNQILDTTFITEHPPFYKLVYAAALFTSRPILDYVPLNAGDPLSAVPYWLKLFSLRLISAFFGAAAVFLLCLVHPLAGLFLAIDTLGIKYTSVIYLDALPAFTGLVAFLAALKALDLYQKRPGRRWAVWLVLSALALGITAASKYIHALVGLAIIAAIILRGWKQKLPVLLGLAAWGVLSLAFFFIFDPVLWHDPLTRLSSSVLISYGYSFTSHVTHFGYPFWQPIQWLLLPIPLQSYQQVAFRVGPGNYFILADSVIFFLALVGLPALYRKNKPMLLWLVIGLAILLVWSTKWPQYTLLILPPLCMSAACGFDFIRSRLPKAWAKITPPGT